MEHLIKVFSFSWCPPLKQEDEQRSPRSAGKTSRDATSKGFRAVTNWDATAKEPRVVAGRKIFTVLAGNGCMNWTPKDKLQMALNILVRISKIFRQAAQGDSCLTFSDKWSVAGVNDGWRAAIFYPSLAWFPNRGSWFQELLSTGAEHCLHRRSGFKGFGPWAGHSPCPPSSPYLPYIFKSQHPFLLGFVVPRIPRGRGMG